METMLQLLWQININLKILILILFILILLKYLGYQL